MEWCHDTIILLFTVSEDRATQRCDLSAGTEVSGKGDASSIALFLSPPFMVMLESAIHVISDCSMLIELCLLSYFSALWPIAVSLAFTLAKWRFVWQVTF